MEAARALIAAYVLTCIYSVYCRDEDKISKGCYWPHEVFEACFGGCAEVSCDNPRNHMRPCYPYCEPGCVCEEPYVRDDRTHQCVMPQDCSPTQMGIPVPTKRNKPTPQKSSRISRSHKEANTRRRKEDDKSFEGRALLNAEGENQGQHQFQEEFKRNAGTPEVSRMGNYFNIVIAPPPIKALQPRKLLKTGQHPISKRSQ